MPQIYSCEHCDYITDRQYNYNRHIVRHHIDIVPENTTADLQNNNIDLQNNNIDLQNNNIDLQNNNIDLQNNNIDSTNNIIKELEHTALPFQCSNCYKSLSTKYSLMRHESCCKGIKHPLQCQYCHHCYTSQQSKCRHEKTCKEKEKSLKATVPINTTNNIELQQNADTINNTTNNNTTNHNTTNNNTINLVVFPLANDKLIQFNTDHITMEKLLQIVQTSTTPPDGLDKFTNMILQNPANHIIKKDNKREPHSKVHIGNNRWRIVQDKKIYPKLTDSISSEVAHKIEFDLPAVSKQKKKPHLEYYNDIVSTVEPTQQYREAKKIIEYAIINHLSEHKD